MEKTRLFCLAFCVILLLQCWLVPSFADEQVSDASIMSGSHTVDALVPMLGSEQFITNAESVILYEAGTETLMYAWNADAQMYPASLVKIMTAWIAAEQGTMTDAVTVSANVLATVAADAVTVDLQADEVISLEDLLYCMMVGSANDAAAVIADHIAGSQQAFVAMMNSYAAELGCTGTRFTNAHGLHDDQQYTTARDVARILSAALENELFSTIFNTTHYTVEATNKSEARNLASGNYLVNQDSVQIYYDSRVTGSRTGVTTLSDRCIASVAEANGLQLVCVILGAKSAYADDGYSVKIFGGYKETSELLNKGFDGYKAVQVLYDNQALAQYSVANGSSDVVIGPKVSVSTVLPQNVTKADLTYHYSDAAGTYTAPIDKGQSLSNVQIWYGGLCLAQAELYAMNEVSVQQTQTVSDDTGKKSAAWPAALTVVIVIAVCLAGCVLVIRLIHRIRIVSSQNRSRRYRRNRRRSR